MDRTTTRNVALLSIRPEYVKHILNGTKRVEFRKTKLPPQLRHVVIYCTSPIKLVVAFFSVGEIVCGKPEHIWRRYSHVAGVSYDFFSDYYQESESAIAIEVAQVYQLRKSMPLHDLDSSLSPPQSFRYLPDAFVTKLQRRTIR